MTEKQWADEAEARKATLLSKMGGEESFRRGFDQRSHFPEKAAANALSAGLSYWEQGVAAVRTAGGDDELAKLWEERFLKKWVAYQQAGARCANWFITGPANFPVERNRKRRQGWRAEMAEKTSVKKQFRLSGVRMRATVVKTEAGWKIFSVGALDLPTALLPFEITRVAMDLVRRDAFPTKEAAFGALNNPPA